MNWDDGISLLGAPGPAGEKPGLDRIRELMERLGNPQKELRYLHIAGTNGKGSAAAMISGILGCAGYRTGRYISPHLVRINERFSVNGQEIPDETYAHYARMVGEAAAGMQGSPSLFERLTAVAFLYFRDQACDIVVLEVGLGGRFDATNVIDSSEVSLIMHLGLEHTELLGNTLEEIAFEKAGIIRPGGTVVLQHQDERAEQTIRGICNERGAALTITASGELVRKTADPDELTIDYRQRREVRLGLHGSYQAQNAAVVLDTVDILNREKGYDIPEEAVRDGLLHVHWPGRFDVISQAPPVILDGAHNPDGCQALAESIREGFPGKKLILVMGVMADKNVSRMLDSILEACRYAAPPITVERFIAVAPAGARSLARAALAETASAMGLQTETAETVRAGLARAMSLASGTDGKSIVLVFGSLYLAGEILQMADML